MTYAGQNLDIVTGIAAVAAGLAAWRWPARARPLAALFNVAGTLLLLNVLRVALGSRPFPLGLFREGPPLALPFHMPFTWIVPLCVAPALPGHLILFRALASRHLSSTPRLSGRSRRSNLGTGRGARISPS
jgi:hypothetical protein